MLSQIRCGTIRGLTATMVTAEADVSDGLPVFDMVGSLSGEVKECRERVRTVLKAAGFPLPARHITVNLSPADIRKSGNGFDLPVALSVLAALGRMDPDRLSDVFVCGELRLSGEVLPVKGMLPMLLVARENGIKKCIIPVDNLQEARLVPDMEPIGVGSFAELLEYIDTGRVREYCPDKDSEAIMDDQADFGELHGQAIPRRACEIAAAGMHNLLMYGPPGAGKSMIARCLPSIMPPLSDDEKLELMKIYSICGKFRISYENIRRPFRSPHHTTTAVAMSGGGNSLNPGEITMAHNGVLFLDELPEFKREALEALRQPLEEGKINIVRNRYQEEYPADFLFVAAMNPCRCGYYPSERCTCSTPSIRHYLSKISEPLLDRFDLCVQTRRVEYGELMDKSNNESSERIRERVLRAHDIQRERYRDKPYTFNSQASSKMIEEYCRLTKATRECIGELFASEELTARGYYRILKVSRTIADLAGKKDVGQEHIAEAGFFRSLDRRFWEVVR